MPRHTTALCLVILAATISACHETTQPHAPTAARAPQTTPAAAAAEPTQIDLRPHLTELGLVPRAQGARGTCSIFTTCEVIEFAFAKQNQHTPRLSPEYVNWAAGQAAGNPSDGNFFHNAVAGFERLGICTEEQMPYQPKFDAATTPSPAASADAARIREASRGVILVHWIVPWTPNHFGVDDKQFAQIKNVLARGYPVAAGSGHSRLLVGFQDDASKPGGGTFLTEDSALARFDEVTYDFVRTQVADVFWVGCVEPTKASSSAAK